MKTENSEDLMDDIIAIAFDEDNKIKEDSENYIATLKDNNILEIDMKDIKISPSKRCSWIHLLQSLPYDGFSFYLDSVQLLQNSPNQYFQHRGNYHLSQHILNYSCALFLFLMLNIVYAKY